MIECTLYVDRNWSIVQMFDFVYVSIYWGEDWSVFGLRNEYIKGCVIYVYTISSTKAERIILMGRAEKEHKNMIRLKGNICQVNWY